LFDAASVAIGASSIIPVIANCADVVELPPIRRSTTDANDSAGWIALFVTSQVVIPPPGQVFHDGVPAAPSPETRHRSANSVSGTLETTPVVEV